MDEQHFTLSTTRSVLNPLPVRQIGHRPWTFTTATGRPTHNCGCAWQSVRTAPVAATVDQGACARVETAASQMRKIDERATGARWGPGIPVRSAVDVAPSGNSAAQTRTKVSPLNEEGCTET